MKRVYFKAVVLVISFGMLVAFCIPKQSFGDPSKNKVAVANIAFEKKDSIPNSINRGIILCQRGLRELGYTNFRVIGFLTNWDKKYVAVFVEGYVEVKAKGGYYGTHPHEMRPS